MITLHILQLLEDNDFGVIDTDLFFEKLGLDKVGLYITSRGSSLSRGTRTTQLFDIYSRGSDDVDGMERLERVLEFLTEAEGTVCDLPAVPGVSTNVYKNVDLEPTSNVENVGLDANNRVIYVISGQVRYNKLKEN